LLTANDGISETRGASTVTIHCRDGLQPVELMNCVNAIVNNLHPRYSTTLKEV